MVHGMKPQTFIAPMKTYTRISSDMNSIRMDNQLNKLEINIFPLLASSSS